MDKATTDAVAATDIKMRTKLAKLIDIVTAKQGKEDQADALKAMIAKMTPSQVGTGIIRFRKLAGQDNDPCWSTAY